MWAVQWIAPLPDSKRVLGSNSGWAGLGLSVWSWHVLLVYAWVLSGYSIFLPSSKNRHFRLMGDSKLTLGVGLGIVRNFSIPVPSFRYRFLNDTFFDTYFIISILNKKEITLHVTVQIFRFIFPIQAVFLQKK